MPVIVSRMLTSPLSWLRLTVAPRPDQTWVPGSRGQENGELERRLGGGTVIHVSNAVGGDAHTSRGQLYSVVVLIERP